MPAPGANVTVTIEVGYCPFCRRTRNLRREERHLGGLMRTTIECESCHRVLSSTIGPPAPPPPPAEPERQPEQQPQPEPEPAPKPAARRRAPAAAAKAPKTRAKAPTRKKAGA